MYIHILGEQRRLRRVYSEFSSSLNMFRTQLWRGPDYHPTLTTCRGDHLFPLSLERSRRFSCLSQTGHQLQVANRHSCTSPLPLSSSRPPQYRPPSLVRPPSPLPLLSLHCRLAPARESQKSQSIPQSDHCLPLPLGNYSSVPSYCPVFNESRTLSPSSIILNMLVDVVSTLWTLLFLLDNFT